MTETVPKTKEVLSDSITQGPMSILDTALKENIQVFIGCRYNKSLICKVVAFDKHFNMVLKDVTEVWSQRNGERQDRHIRNLFLRGDSVVYVVLLRDDGSAE